MPTIDQLTPAVVAADDDLLPISQGGTTRSITRSQLLAGTQPALAVGRGLLGRASASVGAPGQIPIGGGLSFSNGMLTSPAAFSISSLAGAGGVNATDLLPLLQSGMQVAIPAAALVSVAGADASGHLVAGPSGSPRTLGSWLADSVSVEAFGAVGDGTTDDTAAFNRAIASGRPVRLGAKTYRVDGQWTIAASCVLLGSPGQSVLRRGQQAGGAWIEIVGAEFTAIGVTFDAAGLSADSWGVLIGASCVHSSLSDCVFMNALGATLGSGLVLQARAVPSGGSECHTIRNCTFKNNTVHGLWVQAASRVLVEGCLAFGNQGYGICLDFNDPAFRMTVRDSAVIGCRAWGNQRGISVGNFNETNVEPPRWGLANPDALDVCVAANICNGNTGYGIAVSGERIRVRANQVTAGAAGRSGILFNAANSTLEGNAMLGTGDYGIDAGGCASCEISGNSVDSFKVGINPGGSTGVRVVGNRLVGNGRAITVFQVETDGNGRNFGLGCRDLWIDRNFVDISAGGSGGILVFDGAQSISVTNNEFFTDGAPAGTQALVLHTDSAAVSGNRLNGAASIVCNSAVMPGGSSLSLPDLLDHAVVPATIGRVVEVSGNYQSTVVGQVTFVRVTDPGAGYTTARVTIAGAGTGASATAYIRDGLIIGVAVTGGGSGYDLAATQATIVGDGSGASLAVSVGLPVLSGRRLVLQCEGQTTFGSPQVTSWIGSSFTAPAGSEVKFNGTARQWLAVALTSVDFVQPASNGELTLASRKGDIRLLPGAGGQVRRVSASEAIGCLSCIGRGSPEGVVEAPPGSDYRNLDGGVRNTLWLKQVGFGSNGWAALA